MHELTLVTFPLTDEKSIRYSECDWGRLVVRKEGSAGVVQFHVTDGMHKFRIAWSNGNNSPWFGSLQDMEREALKPLNIKLYQI